jgi:hypothetical protein
MGVLYCEKNQLKLGKTGNPNQKTVFVWIVDLKLSNLRNPNNKVGNPKQKQEMSEIQIKRTEIQIKKPLNQRRGMTSFC